MSDFVTIESGTSKALWDWYRASSCNLKHFVTNKWMHCTDIPPESSLRILSFTEEKATKLKYIFLLWSEKRPSKSAVTKQVETTLYSSFCRTWNLDHQP